MTDETRLRALLAAATPRPLMFRHAGAADEIWTDRGLFCELALFPRGSRQTQADAELIVEAVNSLEGVLDENARLRAVIEILLFAGWVQQEHIDQSERIYRNTMEALNAKG
jgi:hypothetical protein